MTVDLQHQKTAAAIDHRLLLLRKIALYRKKHTRQSFAVGRHIGVIRLVEIRHTEEVIKQSLSFENKRVVRQAAIGLLILVILVVDITHDLLKHILQVTSP